MRIRLAVLLLIWLSPAAADSLRCIADPKRLKACPHLLYRVAQLPGMSSPAVVCICATDFAPLLQPATTESEQISQNMTRRQLEVQHGEKLQSVLDILKRRI